MARKPFQQQWWNTREGTRRRETIPAGTLQQSPRQIHRLTPRAIPTAPYIRPRHQSPFANNNATRTRSPKTSTNTKRKNTVARKPSLAVVENKGRAPQTRANARRGSATVARAIHQLIPRAIPTTPHIRPPRQSAAANIRTSPNEIT